MHFLVQAMLGVKNQFGKQIKFKITPKYYSDKKKGIAIQAIKDKNNKKDKCKKEKKENCFWLG